MQLYFIRHGESTANQDQVYQGWTEVHLSEKGHKQARKLCDYFLKQGITFNTIYSSPLFRASETASHLLPCTLDPHINLKDGLKSINVGRWSELPIDFVKKEFRELHQIWKTEPKRFQFPEGESVYDVLNRAKSTLSDIIAQQSMNSCIAIVSHMITIKVMTLWMLQEDLERIWETQFSVPNTGLILFTVQEKKGGGLSFTRVNLKSPIPHLQY